MVVTTAAPPATALVVTTAPRVPLVDEAALQTPQPMQTQIHIGTMQVMIRQMIPPTMPPMAAATAVVYEKNNTLLSFYSHHVNNPYMIIYKINREFFSLSILHV